MIKIFLGYDAREAVGFHVCVQSIIEHASEPVQIIPLSGKQRDGSNAFTYARFLVPYYCGYEGTAIFLDGSDMLVREDIVPLSHYARTGEPVSVVQHDEYLTLASRKYIGTSMECDNENYPRKNWSSVMVFNCAHPQHKALHPDTVQSLRGSMLHRFELYSDIGTIHPKWNVLIGEYLEDQEECAIAHFTLGIPGFKHYENCKYAVDWRATYYRAITPADEIDL